MDDGSAATCNLLTELKLREEDEKKKMKQRLRELKLRMRKNTPQQHYAAAYSTSPQVLAAA